MCRYVRNYETNKPLSMNMSYTVNVEVSVANGNFG